MSSIRSFTAGLAAGAVLLWTCPFWNHGSHEHALKEAATEDAYVKNAIKVGRLLGGRDMLNAFMDAERNGSFDFVFDYDATEEGMDLCRSNLTLDVVKEVMSSTIDKMVEVQSKHDGEVRRSKAKDFNKMKL